MVYIYDDSYEGFLTAIFDAFNDPDALIYSSRYPGPPMLDNCAVIADFTKSNRLRAGINAKLGKTILRDIYLLYLSDTDDHGIIALEYLRFCFHVGAHARSLRYEPVVKAALTLREKVTREWDRMLGLLRFDKTEKGIYVASFSPDHNVLPLIANHFARRMPSHSFIIHDTSRGIAMLSHKGVWVLTDLDPETEFDFSSDEFRTIWKDYWQTMAIEERLNPRLQQKYMPKRYWKNLTEMQ